MKHVIQIAPEDDVRAWGILVRHSPGIALPNRIVIVSDEAVKTLREAGVRFDELAAPAAKEVVTSERV